MPNSADCYVISSDNDIIQRIVGRAAGTKPEFQHCTGYRRDTNLKKTDDTCILYHPNTLVLLT